MIENFGSKNVCISKFLDHIKILFENFPVDLNEIVDHHLAKIKEALEKQTNMVKIEPIENALTAKLEDETYQAELENLLNQQANALEKKNSAIRKFEGATDLIEKAAAT
jgi:hypothetical protein